MGKRSLTSRSPGTLLRAHRSLRSGTLLRSVSVNLAELRRAPSKGGWEYGMVVLKFED